MLQHVPIVVDEVKTHGPSRSLANSSAQKLKKRQPLPAKIGGILPANASPKATASGFPRFKELRERDSADGESAPNGAHVAGHIEGGNDFRTHLPGISRDFLHVLLGEVPAGPSWGLVLLAVAVPRAVGPGRRRRRGSDHPVARGQTGSPGCRTHIAASVQPLSGHPIQQLPDGRNFQIFPPGIQEKDAQGLVRCRRAAAPLDVQVNPSRSTGEPLGGLLLSPCGPGATCYRAQRRRSSSFLGNLRPGTVGSPKGEHDENSGSPLPLAEQG